MLDVQRSPDIDAGGEQLLDVLPALGMAAVGRVGVSEFVNDDQFRLARERGVEIEFVDFAAVVFDLAPRQDFESINERARLGAAMSLHKPNDDVDVFVLQAPRVLQHCVSLADAGRGAEEHLQAAGSLPPQRGEKRVRIWASIVGST